jgi:hypothetical protein
VKKKPDATAPSLLQAAAHLQIATVYLNRASTALRTRNGSGRQSKLYWSVFKLYAEADALDHIIETRVGAGNRRVKR